MSNAISDFMVHIEEHLSAEQRRSLEASLRGDNCVISAAIPPNTPHLMLVVYDSECTQARHILGAVRDQGLHASLL
jgi:hypothetical protein